VSITAEYISFGIGFFLVEVKALKLRRRKEAEKLD
jgi:hypothetical protein